MAKVFIDGSAGTTGLQIHARLMARSDIQLLTIDEDKRKDPAERQRLMNEADVVFLCLTDAAAIEAAQLVTNPDTVVIDASTAHRCNLDWTYGFAELGLREKIAGAKRIANPGCHATGFISLVHPLVKSGLLPKDALLHCASLTGYTGGGKKMIADYEAEDRPVALASPALYAVGQSHKHLPEMKLLCGLDTEPVFCPIVDDYAKGMATTLMLHKSQLKPGTTLEMVWQALSDFYKGQKLVTVRAWDAPQGSIYANTRDGMDSLEIIVSGNDERMTITALFDNLGKGASGAAIQNMNIALGVDEATGLNV